MALVNYIILVLCSHNNHIKYYQVPDNLLPDATRVVKLDKLPKEEGSSPTVWRRGNKKYKNFNFNFNFNFKIKYCCIIFTNITSGIGILFLPVKEFPCKRISSNFVNSPNTEGIVPLYTVNEMKWNKLVLFYTITISI